MCRESSTFFSSDIFFRAERIDAPMEILRAESNEFAHLKGSRSSTATNGDPQTNNTSSASSTIDDDEEEHDDELSTVSTTEEKRTKSPLVNVVPDERAGTHLDYQRHRERLAKELKDYEERWLAQRNFLLYSQAFGMKNEDRERLFTQMNLSTTQPDEHSIHQQQFFARLSKDERERFFASASLYNPPQTTSQPAFPFPSPYPWSTAASLPPPPPPAAPPTTTTTTNDQSQQPKSPSSDDSGNQSNSGSTTEWSVGKKKETLRRSLIILLSL